jgi:hypothetical protein
LIEAPWKEKKYRRGLRRLKTIRPTSAASFESRLPLMPYLIVVLAAWLARQQDAFIK